MKNILIIGFGDLAYRLVSLLVAVDQVGTIFIAARNVIKAKEQTKMLRLAGKTIEILSCNALLKEDLEKAIQVANPYIIIQSGAFISPWQIYQRRAIDIKLKPFDFWGLQLPFQALIPFQLMQVVKQIGFEGHVINASYPDGVNSFLTTANLQPLCGIGNVGMIAHCISSRYYKAHPEAIVGKPVSVIAHHLHVKSVLMNTLPAERWPNPKAWIGIESVDHLSYSPPSIKKWSREINTLTAISSIDVINALFDEYTKKICSIPGPFGLPGGYPCCVSSTGLQLSLPEEISNREAIELNIKAAHFEGLFHNSEGEFVDFTPALKASLINLDSFFIEKLSADNLIYYVKKLGSTFGIPLPQLPV